MKENPRQHPLKNNLREKKKRLILSLTALSLLVFGYIVVGRINTINAEPQRNELIKTIATAQPLNSEIIPDVPINCDGSAVIFSVYDENSFEGGGSANLIVKETISAENNPTEGFERSLYTTAYHIVNTIKIDTGNEIMRIGTTDKPNHGLKNISELQIEQIIHIKDNSGDDAALIIVRGDTANKLPDYVKPIGITNVHGWISKPDRMILASYPYGLDSSLVVKELDTEKIDYYVTDTGIFIKTSSKNGSSPTTAGDSGGGVCIQKTDKNNLRDGVLVAMHVYHNSTDVNNSVLNFFPSDIQYQINEAWNQLP